MNRTLVGQIAAAVLYEGYTLYPYRPSVKNRQRWTFGGVYPRAWAEANGSGDACAMRTECLVTGNPESMLAVTVRFLHLIDRTVGELAPPLADWPPDREPDFRTVQLLRVGERQCQPWQEASDREVPVGEWRLADLTAGRRHEFTSPASRSLEPLRDSGGMIVGVLVREQQAIEGRIELVAEVAGDGVFKVSAEVVNSTPVNMPRNLSRAEAQLRSFVSMHALLGVRGGAFVSLTDPPQRWREAADKCRNVGAWPVLVGAEGDTDAVLASPIILPDYPQIAPESPGDLFDGTEIDEILTLRVLTLTDEEKRMAIAVDDRVKALFERTEALGREQLMGLHGTVRGIKPIPEEVARG